MQCQENEKANQRMGENFAKDITDKYLLLKYTENS